MCDLIRHSQSESWKSPCPDSSTRVFYFCTPTSSRVSPQSTSSASETYSDESLLGTSPHEDFTSFYISPLRCTEYVLRSSSPSKSIAQFSRRCQFPSVEPPTLLGAGGFGRVVLSSYNSKSVALKQVRGSGSAQQRLLGRELLAFLVPASPFVVSALGFTVAECCFHVMSELVDGGNLQSLLDREDEVEERMKMDAIHQIASALAHCHSFSILHLDVKPSNVLFVKATRSFKLADFGCSMRGRRELVECGGGSVEVLSCPDHERLIGGTIPYQAPEIFKKSGVCCRSDVYSLGICAWQILTGITPYFGHDRHFVVYTVVKNDTRPAIDRIGPPFESFRELLPILWSPDALSRPSSLEVLQMIGTLCM